MPSVRGGPSAANEPGNIYATIYCPHRRPVEVINTDKKPINVNVELGAFMKESAGYRDNYCYH